MIRKGYDIKVCKVCVKECKD